MASRSLLAVLVLGMLLVSVGAHDHADHAKSRADEAQAKVVEGTAAAHDSAQSWTEAAKEKLNTVAADAKDKVGGTVGAATDYAYDAMGAAKEYAYDTMGVAKDTTGAAKEKSAEGAAAAQDSAQSYLDMAKEKLNVFSKYDFISFKRLSYYFSLLFHSLQCVFAIRHVKIWLW